MTEQQIKAKFKEAKIAGNKKEINRWSKLVDKIVQAKETTLNIRETQASPLQRQLDDLASDRMNSENFLTAEDISRKPLETTQTGNISELTAETTPRNVFDDAIMGDIIVKRDGVYTYNKDQVRHEYSGFKQVGDSVEGIYLGSRTGVNKFDPSKEQQIYEVQKPDGTIVDVYSKPSIDKQMDGINRGQGVRFELTDKIKSKTPGYSPFNVITVSSVPTKKNAKPITAEEGVTLGRDTKEVTDYLDNNRKTYLNIISDVNKKNEGWKYPEKHPETKWTVKASPTAYIAEFKKGIDKGLKGNKNARAFNYTLDESLKKIFGKDYQNNDKLSSLLNPTEGKGKTIWSDLYKTIGESQPKDVVLKEAEARKAGKDYLGKEEYQAIYQKRKEQAAAEADARYEGSDNVIVTNPATGREVLVNKKEYIGSLPEQDMSRLDTVADLTRFDSLLKSLRAAEVTGKALTPEDAALTAKDLLYKLIKLYNENYPKSKNGQNIRIDPAELKKITELALKKMALKSVESISPLTENIKQLKQLMTEKPTGKTIAIIGTAGRDKNVIMDKATWEKMLSDAKKRVSPEDVLISGGAAWSDHLAVKLFLDGKVSGLKLRLPAPIDPKTGRFVGGFGTSGGAANYYHDSFSKTIGVDTLAEIKEAIKKGADVSYEPTGSGYGAMFARNSKVASEANKVIAYTHGTGNIPADGGTKQTWDKNKSEDKIHVSIGGLSD